MSTFKITNITNLIGKRGFKHNSVVEAEYVDGMVKKTLKIKPQETVYITLSSLPLSIHRLRIKGLVTVTEMSKKEIKELLAAEKQKENAKKTDTPKKTTKKKTTSLNIEDDVNENKVEKPTKRRTTKKDDVKEDKDDDVKDDAE